MNNGIQKIAVRFGVGSAGADRKGKDSDKKVPSIAQEDQKELKGDAYFFFKTEARYCSSAATIEGVWG